MITVINSPYGAWWKWEYDGVPHYVRPQQIVEIEVTQSGTGLKTINGTWLDIPAPISEVVALLGIEV